MSVIDSECVSSLQDRDSIPSHCRLRRGHENPSKSIASILWDWLHPIARLWGLITAVVLSGAGAELVVLGYEAAPALLVGAAVVLMLETMWAVALFVDLLARRGEYTLSLRCWDFMRWSCAKARAPFYACAATALLFSRLTLLASISGGMLLVLATLRAVVPFSPYASHGRHTPRAGSSLISQHDSPLPSVFYNAAHSGEDARSEEMTVLDVKTNLPSEDGERSRPVTPKQPLLEL
uniref:Odorant receptor n=1 Tax=Leucinodes orbonalis TaxID=711050 RepID=A0AAU0QLV9_9NEOP|nr:odorant receptor [Leucinodes orbonalis]